MKDQSRIKRELLEENTSLMQKIHELEQSESVCEKMDVVLRDNYAGVA